MNDIYIFIYITHNARKCMYMYKLYPTFIPQAPTSLRITYNYLPKYTVYKYIIICHII